MELRIKSLEETTEIMAERMQDIAEMQINIMENMNTLFEALESERVNR